MAYRMQTSVPELTDTKAEDAKTHEMYGIDRVKQALPIIIYFIYYLTEQCFKYCNECGINSFFLRISLK